MKERKFPVRLKQCRLNADYTQSDLGKLVSVSKVSISGYENATRTPDVSTLIKLAQVFKVPVDWLLGVDTDENETDYKKKEYIANILTQSKVLYDFLEEDPFANVSTLENFIKELQGSSH